MESITEHVQFEYAEEVYTRQINAPVTVFITEPPNPNTLDAEAEALFAEQRVRLAAFYAEQRVQAEAFFDEQRARANAIAADFFATERVCLDTQTETFIGATISNCCFL